MTGCISQLSTSSLTETPAKEVFRHFSQEKALENQRLPDAARLLGGERLGLVADNPQFFALGTDAFYHPAFYSSPPIGLEFKFEQQKSRNVCIELISQDANNKLGWFFTSRAAWLVSFFTSHQKHVVFIPMDCLRMALSAYLDSPKELIHMQKRGGRSPFSITSTLNYSNESGKRPIYASWNLLVDLHWILDNVPDAFIVDGSSVIEPSVLERTDSVASQYWKKAVTLSNIESCLINHADPSTPIFDSASQPEQIAALLPFCVSLDLALKDAPFKAGGLTKYDNRVGQWASMQLTNRGYPSFSVRPWRSAYQEHLDSGSGQAQYQEFLLSR